MHTILYLIYICATISVVKTNSTAEEPPDITLLSKYNDRSKKYKLICVAGSSVVDTALTFITPLTHKFQTQNKKSQYFENNGSTLSKRFNCDFESSSPCTEIWKRYSEYKIETNGEYNIIPVIDERWEKFETKYTNSLTKMVKIVPKFTNIVQVSVRTSGEAIIVLCEKQIENENIKSYSITIDDTDSNKTRIRYCTNFNETYSSSADFECSGKINDTRNRNLLSEFEWKHFSISQTNDMIKLTELTKGNITQMSIQNNKLNTTFVYITSKKKAAWKFHKFNYLSLKNESDQFRQIGPSYIATKNELFCVTFYVARCTNCTLSIEFNTEEGINKRNISQDTDKLLTPSKWNKVKQLIETKANQRYSLFARNKNIGNITTAYWLIRDVRECNVNETRKISIELAETDLKNTKCQALNSPQWSVGQEDINTAPDIATHFCNVTQYIGKDCNILCNSVFSENSNKSENCNSYSVCKHTTAKIIKCTCASGYFEDKCTKSCPNFMYGYNCMHSCGHCQKEVICEKTSGTCPSKCKFGFAENPYCQTLLYPRLEMQPSLIYSTLSEIKINFNSSKIIGTEPAKTYQIQYQKENNNWKNYGDTQPLGKPTDALENLTSLTNYIIRVVLYTNNNESYQGSDVTTLKVFTNCSGNILNPASIKNVGFDITATSIRIHWTPVCENKIKIKVKCYKKINDWCIETPHQTSATSTEKELKIDDLIPYTNYIIQISEQKSNKLIKDTKFTSKPSAPPKVTMVQVYSKSDNYISVRWQAPYPPHGNLETYLLIAKVFGEKATNPIKIQGEHCNLWDDYLCYKFPDLKPNNKYEINIQSKNWNVADFSKVTALYTTTKEEKSQAPVNVTTYWDDQNVLILNWAHPSITNGDLVAFDITFDQWNTNLKQSAFKTRTSRFHISEQKKTYQYKVKESLPFSTTYKISIQGINQEKGEKATEEVQTPPATPLLIGNVSITVCTNTTRTITIPTADPFTISGTSYMVVAICDTQSKAGTGTIEHIIRSIAIAVNCSGAIRIAQGFENLTMEGVTFKIGDGNGNLVQFKKMQINNEKLKQSENVYLVLVNEYHSQYRYTVLTIEDVSKNKTAHTTYYALFSSLAILLILVAIVGWFVYRHIQKKKNVTETNDILMSNISIHSLSARFKSTSLNKHSEDESSKQLLLRNKSKSNEKLHTNVILINHLAEYVKKSINDGEFKSQHASLKKGPIKSWDYGTKQENKFKNRYNNIAAYDDTRVILKKVSGDQFSDYINANYIDGYKKKKAYIATQGPKLPTINDFWRMIWQEKVEYIVMLANITEGGKKKCEQYWPDLNATREFMNMEVTFLYSDIYADYEYRTFEIKYENQIRKLQQFHFTSWPDHGVPIYPQVLIPFLRKILQISVDRAPIVVHCSAGVGRTGTIILCDICLRMAAQERAIDVFQYFKKMRDHRANMVDNYEQYKLVHIVLLECLLGPDTNIPCDRNFETYVQKITIDGTLESQMWYLIDTAWQYQVMQTKSITEKNGNKEKNRFSNIVPEHNRIYLNRYPSDDEHSDYINAIPVDGFRMKNQFIVTQTPLPHTVSDFWRMVDELDVQVIVSLNEIILNDKTSCIFWPVENGEIIITPYLKIKFHSSKANEYFDLYNIEIKNTSEKDAQISIVNLVQYKNWKPDKGTPKNITTFVSLLEEVQNLSRQRKPTIVTCFDGSQASGLFVALSFAIEKVKLEQKCDVCLAVRVIRQNRPEFIQDKKQFEFLYKAVVNYIDSFETYSNFEVPKK